MTEITRDVRLTEGQIIAIREMARKIPPQGMILYMTEVESLDRLMTNLLADIFDERHACSTATN